MINGTILVLTKVDSIVGAKEFKLSYGYQNGDETVENFSRDEGLLRKFKPNFQSYEGYSDISDAREYEKMPISLKKAINDFETFTGGRVTIVSVGAGREETIVR